MNTHTIGLKNHFLPIAFLILGFFFFHLFSSHVLAAYGDGNYGDGTYGDITAPTVIEVTPVTTPTTDTTPNYTFSSDEAGTITYGGSCSSSTTSATSGNNTITFNTLALGTYADCTLTVTDSSENESDILAITPFTIAAGDSTAPTLSEVTPVTTPTTDTTPNYTFNSDEAGTISYGGSCSSSTTSATSGNNTITFNTLSLGTYDNCTITVTDSSSNASTPLEVSEFTVAAVDNTAPTLAEGTPIPNPTSDTTPNYTFTSNEAGTITYGGTCASSTTAAVSGSNTITFNTLALGTYDDCTITVTDASSNVSDVLLIPEFTIIESDEEDAESGAAELDLSRPKLKWADEVFRLFRDAFPKLNDKEFVLSGTDPDMAGGEIRFYIDGQKFGKTTVADDGEWKKKIRSTKNGEVELVLEYTKNDFEERRHYTLLIDSEEPIFDAATPAVLNKRPGEKIEWQATDNDRVKYYRYEFQGKETKTATPNFTLANTLSDGKYPLLIKAYDRAGNRAAKSISVVISVPGTGNDTDAQAGSSPQGTAQQPGDNTNAGLPTPPSSTPHNADAPSETSGTDEPSWIERLFRAIKSFFQGLFS